ncbi:MAG: imidazolonepropionase [Bacteroidales bacterium]|nr:imidazolonepropionase [Bacteroidales bacterium]
MKVITNIKGLVQASDRPLRKVCGKDMQKLSVVENAFLLFDEQTGKIVDFGSMEQWKSLSQQYAHIEETDASGRFVFPAFCDSHTHIVYAGSREIEYNDKIRGLSYEEIAKRGGGILNSVDRLRAASEDELFDAAWERLQEMCAYGTGAAEIKSGYGLDLKSELKMLRVIARLKQKSPMTIRANFLGAHAVPREYIGRQTEYVDLIVNEMIPAVAAEKLADFVDVFCDKGFFTVHDTERILEAGAKYGMKPKIHANELALSGGIQVGVKYGALSVDHLEYVGKDEIAALKDSETMPTVLPGAAFFLGMPLSPVRDMMEAGLPVALASDYNPGSSPSGNMQFVMSLGCVRYRMYPEEVVHATTINTACALGVSDSLGSIERGKTANFYITKKIPTYEYMPYSFGNNKVETVYLQGKRI